MCGDSNVSMGNLHPKQHQNNQLLRVGSFMWLDRSRFQEYKSDNHNRIISTHDIDER